MTDMLANGFNMAEQEIFNSLRLASTEERTALLKTLDALHIVHKQLIILLDREETSDE